MGNLDGKTAIVTGGGRGIGRAIALAFAGQGADVCVLARSRAQLDEVAREITATGRRGVALVCDVADRESVEQAFATARSSLGRLDVLVNNAGGGSQRQPLGSDDPADWQRVVQVNLLGTYHCCRAALPHFRASGGGSISNVGSGMGHQPRANKSSYHAAKAGVWMLTRCLALELWQEGIRVNELIPGPVHTQLTEGLFEPDQPHPVIESEWVKRPEDVSELALFLASQSERGPTGQSFSLARRPL